jgi:hypothetical protein
MNSHNDREAGWGGQTVVLDDNGRFGLESNPAFEDLEREVVAEAMYNRCFIFARKLNSWHVVREIQYPSVQGQAHSYQQRAGDVLMWAADKRPAT